MPYKIKSLHNVKYKTSAKVFGLEGKRLIGHDKDFDYYEDVKGNTYSFDGKKLEKLNDKEYYLVNIKENTYDPHLIKGWDNAVHLNLAYQIGTGEESVVPMEKSWVLKNKLKKSKFL